MGTSNDSAVSPSGDWRAKVVWALDTSLPFVVIANRMSTENDAFQGGELIPEIEPRQDGKTV